MQMKEIANRLEDAEMQMWVLSSLLFVTNEAVKDKPGPEGDYAGVLCLASDMAKDLEDELRALRELAFDVLHQNKTLPEAVQPENPPGGGQSEAEGPEEKKDTGLGKDTGAAQGRVVPCEDSRRDGCYGGHNRHRAVTIEKGGGRKWEEAER